MLFIQGIQLTGIFLVFFGVTLWVLVQKSQDGRINKALLATILSLFAISTSHLIIDCVRMVQGFIGGAATPYGARAYFSNLGRPTHVAKVALFMAQTCVGDSFVIYRCFVVWSPSRRWGIIAFPLALLGGTIISGIGVLYATTRETTPGATVFLAVLVPWITSFFALTLCTNIVCTVLIAFRIWRAQRPVRPIVQHSALRPFMVVVIESGAIYSAALLSMLVVYASGSVGQYPALDYVRLTVSLAV
ncbi:hypothetical protein C8R44DRAFT_635915 [Mycena epipterygia]|nr:hypothetical protein C8R44DRAFT_635915 [Mycena epipterygia]